MECQITAQLALRVTGVVVAIEILLIVLLLLLIGVPQKTVRQHGVKKDWRGPLREENIRMVQTENDNPKNRYRKIHKPDWFCGIAARLDA